MTPETQVPTAVTEKLEQALVKKIDAGEVELPLLPQVASQVMALAADASAERRPNPSLLQSLRLRLLLA